MNRLESVLVDVATRLGREGVGFALVGGLAVWARSEPRRILGKITERGFARNRDLRSRLDEALARWHSSTRSH